jgi:type IV secretory pathway VirB10-like protein
MNEPSADSLVKPAPFEGRGAVTIRRSALVACGLAIAIVLAVSLWLTRSEQRDADVEPPAARAADPTLIDERMVKASDALTLPTTPPAPLPRPDSEVVASEGFVPAAPLRQERAPFANENFVPRAPVSALAPTPSGKPQAATLAGSVALGRERATFTRLATRDTEGDARNADLEVKLNNAGSETTSATARDEAAVDCACVLERGAIIPASLYTPIDSTVPGTITAQVRKDVYDATHQSLLIPRGSRLVGKYASTMANGQARLFVAFDWIKLPNGRPINLGNIAGVDLQGVAGLGGEVDFHTSRLLGNVVLLSILGVGTQLAQPRNSGSIVISDVRQGVAQQTSSVASQIASNYLGRQPTIHTPAGYLLNVMVEHDLRLVAYTQ